MNTNENEQGTQAAEPSQPRSTHFDFQARVFQALGAHFVLKGKDKEPMFAVDMGAGQGFVTLDNLRKTFFIEPGSHDDRLIDQAAAGLRHIPDIRPGDEIPNEILDGSASWTVSPRHKQIARERIQAQLLSWISGSPVTYADQEELKKIMATEENKRALREAFGKAAVALGFQAKESERVLERIETVARELCYIEALRERTKELATIRANLAVLAKVYNDDQRTSANISRMKVLIVRGIGEPVAILKGIDAEVADVMAALTSVDDIIRSVRKARDDLHFVLMEWDPVIASWQKLTMARSQGIDRALSATYQFLASRFSTGKSLIKRKAPTKRITPTALSTPSTPPSGQDTPKTPTAKE